MLKPTSRLINILPLFLIYFLSYAQNTWTGNIDNQWDLDANWSLGHVPTALEEVLISSDSVFIPQGFDGQIAKLTVGAEAILNIEEGGNLHLRGWNQIAYDQAGFMNFGKFSCSGTFNIDSLELAAIVNDGIFIIDAFGSTILTNNAGGLVNNGIFRNLQ